MNVRRVKRKCGVRGCKCTDSYAISLAGEVGNTVIICKSCLGKALGAIDDVPAEPTPKRDAIPPLFYHPERAVKAPVQEEAPAPAIEEPIQDAEPEKTDDAQATPPAEASEFVCPHCGQVCKSELGLQKHITAKHKELA